MFNGEYSDLVSKEGCSKAYVAGGMEIGFRVVLKNGIRNCDTLKILS